MGSFFKSFGKGILYILTLPAVLIVLAFYAAVGLITFLFLMIKSVVLFFSGKTIFSELPEDIKAREILNPTPKQSEEPVEVIEPEQDNLSSAFTQTFFQGPTTVYPTMEQQEIKEIKTEDIVPQLETPQEIVEQSIEEQYEDDGYMEEPDTQLGEGEDDIDLDLFDIGAKRITKDEE